MKILDPNGLVDNIYKYVQTNIEIAKVEVQEKIEDTIKKVAIIAVLALSGAMLFIFILLTLALFLNQVLVSHYLGFLIVSILLAVIMAITFFMAKQFLNSDKEMEKESLSEIEPLP
jgi:cytochrome c biogenesis protein CcdA